MKRNTIDQIITIAPWYKGKFIGRKSPLKLKEIWAIRIRLQIANRIRECAMWPKVVIQRPIFATKEHKNRPCRILSNVFKRFPSIWAELADKIDVESGKYWTPFAFSTLGSTLHISN